MTLLVSRRATVVKGHYGWGLVTAVVLAWDLLSEDSLSAAFGRGVAGEHRIKVTGIWLILTMHLFKKLPKRIDPFYLFLGGMKRIIPKV